MSEELFACKCGSKLFYRNYRANGWWKQLIESDNSSLKFEVVDTFLDEVKYGAEPKTIRCADCKRRVKNPAYQT